MSESRSVKEKKTIGNPAKKSSKKFRKWIAGIFVAIGYHMFVMAYGAAVVHSGGEWISWDVATETMVNFGDLFQGACSKSPDAIALIRDASDAIETSKIDW